MCKKVVCFDLDDTLYKEIDFLKSGYRKVAEMVAKRYGLEAREVYERFFSWYQQGENPFMMLNEAYGLDNPVSDYLNVYRFHHPLLTLSDEVVKTLNALKEKGVLMGIISDGREDAQKNKVEALGLAKWINKELVFINEDKEYFKPNHWAFDKMMLNCFEMGVKADADFYYVGDNTEKDFLAPNELGWTTVCLLDDGQNIHKQDFGKAKDLLPKYRIGAIMELVRIINDRISIIVRNK